MVKVACVASVPVLSERNSGSAYWFFAFGTREKWGESKKVEGRGFLLSAHFSRGSNDFFGGPNDFFGGPNFVRFVRDACYAGYGQSSCESTRRLLNCQIVRSSSLTNRINYKFMSVRLLTIKISQWARENFCSYRKNSFQLTGKRSQTRSLKHKREKPLTAIFWLHLGSYFCTAWVDKLI